MNGTRTLFTMHIFGGCVPFIIFKRKKEEARGKKKRLAKGETTAKGRCAVKSQQSKHDHKAKHTITTKQTFISRASHFSKPQNMSDRDRVWAQAYRFGCRWFKSLGLWSYSYQLKFIFNSLIWNNERRLKGKLYARQGELYKLITMTLPLRKGKCSS